MKIKYLVLALLIATSNLSAQYGHWEKLNPKNNPGERWGFELTPIGDHQAILFGGIAGGIQKLSDTWLYDLSTNEWKKINCSIFPSGRKEYSLTQISKNKVLLFGGEADSVIQGVGLSRNDFWIFDLDSMNWYKVQLDTSEKVDARYRHRSTLFNDSTILIFSGITYWGFTNDIYLFNFKTNTISHNLITNPLVYPRELTHLDRLTNNFVYIFGGNSGNGKMNDNLIIDDNLKINEINEIKNNCIPISNGGMRRINDGFFLLFGGVGMGQYYNSTWYDGTWLFDYYNKNWIKLELDLNPIGRINPGVALIDTNKVLMYGGVIKNVPDKSFKTDTWLFTLDSVPTGITEIPDNYQFIYPNPSTDFIEISYPPLERGSGGGDIKIYDIFGQIVSTPNPTPALPASEEGVRMDVSNLAPGMYFVRIWDRVGKFIKIK